MSIFTILLLIAILFFYIGVMEKEIYTELKSEIVVKNVIF